MESKLHRGLGLLDAYSLVIGSIIGTGVFLKSATMSQTLQNPTHVVAAWVVAGLLSICGALVYAEISGLFPKAGGEYAYLREGYGGFWSYLYGWTRFLVASPATIAAYSVGSATFLSGFVSLESVGGIPWVAVMLILAFTFLNCFKVTFGGLIQSIMTILKITLIVGLGLCLIFLSGGSMQNFVTQGSAGFQGVSAFGTALLAALWAYDGWNNLPMVGEEVKNPHRNLPLALIFGILSSLLIYASINFTYFYALSFDEILVSNSNAFPDALPVATNAAKTFLGAAGVGVLSILFVFCAVSAMNGSILTSARVPFAMADDGLFFKKLASVHPRSKVPVNSLIVQAIVSCVFALSGKFDQLTDYVVFSSWIFYALVTSSVFIFRKRLPDAHRTYKVWGYPVLPAVFILAAIFLLINTLITSFYQSMIGLMLIMAGVPLYWYFKKHSK